MISPKPMPSKSSRSPLRKPSLIALSGLLLAIAIPGTMVYGPQLGELPTAFGTVLMGQSAAPAYKFKVGDRLVYQLDYRNAATADLRALFSDLKNSAPTNPTAPNSFVSAFENQVQGELSLTIVAPRPEGFLVAYQIHQPIVRIQASGQAIQSQAQLVQSDLSQPIFATIDPQGKILSLRFAANTSKIAQSFARTLFAAMQFVTPAQASGSSWETQEDDPNGQYTAKYESQSGQFQKSKLRYRQPEVNPTTSNSKITPKIASNGQLVASFDRAQGHLVTLKGQETQTFEVSQKKVGQSETNLDLAYRSQMQLPETAVQTLREAGATRERESPAVTLSQTLSEGESDANIQRQQLGDSTLASLLAELDAAEKAADPAANHTPLYLKFKALVYLQPQTSMALAQRLQQAEADQLSMQLLVGALSAIGHESAQAALVQVLEDHVQDGPTSLLVIPSLATVPHPSVATVTALNQVAFTNSDQRVASTAQLALGAVARNLANQATEDRQPALSDRANAIVDRFIQNLAIAKADDAIKQNLLVLGNAGAARSLPAIAKFVTASAAEIRAIALVSLRWIPDPQVDRLLNQALNDDIDETVRTETAVALGFRPMTAANFANQKQVLTADPSVKVRLAVLQNLWQVREQFTEVENIVKQLAQSDPAADLRQAATDLLAAAPP